MEETPLSQSFLRHHPSVGMKWRHCSPSLVTVEVSCYPKVLTFLRGFVN